MKPPIPRDAPRCKRCGVRLPLHVAGCPETPVQDEIDYAEGDNAAELPGRDARECIEVVPWGETE